MICLQREISFSVENTFETVYNSGDGNLMSEIQTYLPESVTLLGES